MSQSSDDLRYYLPELVVIINRLDTYYTYKEAVTWLMAPHPQLESNAPIDLIREGRADRVVEVLNRLDTDAYL